MNSATPEFDALAATRELVAAGLDRKQAKAIVVAVHAGRVGLATKADLDSLETRIYTRFGGLEARIDARFAGLETRMIRVAITIVLAQTALTSVLTAGLTFGLLEMFGGA